MGQNISRSAVDERWLCPNAAHLNAAVDLKKLQRLIKEGKLAPCHVGMEEEAVTEDVKLEYCPICFLFYPALNRSRCCGKSICTECFLQIKAPVRERSAPCPFCKTASYAVEYRGPKTAEERAIEDMEEQRVIELKLSTKQNGREWTEVQPPMEETASVFRTLCSANFGTQASGSSGMQSAEIMDNGIDRSEEHGRWADTALSAANSSTAELEEIMVMHAMAISAAEHTSAAEARSSRNRSIQTLESGALWASSGIIIDEMLTLMGLDDNNAQAGATDDRITIDGILSSMMLSNAEGNGHGAESPCLYNRSINHAGPSGSSCHGCPSLISNADWPQQGSQYGFPREETDMRILKEYLLGEEEVVTVGVISIEFGSSSRPAARADRDPLIPKDGESAAGCSGDCPPQEAVTTEQTERDSAQMNTNTGGGQACGLSVDQIMLEPWEVSAEGMGDARFAEKLRMDDQIQQWSRPADERDGRPLTDHRIEDAVARGDAQITQSINTSDAFLLESIMSLDKPEQQVIANADAQLLEQLQRQDKEFRIRLQGK